MYLTQTGADHPGQLHGQLASLPFVTYLDDVQLSDRLRSSPNDGTILVACSDMGSNLPYVCGAPETNLLIFQNFGHRTSQEGIADLLAGGGISHLIVYGHGDCEFARFLAGPQEPGDAGHADSMKVSECFVLSELKSLLQSPEVMRRAEAQQLQLHGWVYAARRNSLEVFHSESRGFVIAGVKYRERSGC